MNMAEKVFEEVRTLPEFELREVLDFVGYLKTKQGIITAKPENGTADLADEEADWAEFEKLAGTWSGKFNREDCYDRKVLR
ncbi:MAG: hypothetical protein Q8O25_11370 [Sulfurisoma sp.]|nr:hypothetical protein [Sulfurisoma sp.]